MITVTTSTATHSSRTIKQYADLKSLNIGQKSWHWNIKNDGNIQNQTISSTGPKRERRDSSTRFWSSRGVHISDVKIWLSLPKLSNYRHGFGQKSIFNTSRLLDIRNSQNNSFLKIQNKSKGAVRIGNFNHITKYNEYKISDRAPLLHKANPYFETYDMIH